MRTPSVTSGQAAWAIVLFGAAFARTATSAPRGGDALLHDFAVDAALAPRVVPAASRTLVASFFPKSLSSSDACTPRRDGSSIDDQRAAGQFAPTIVGEATGAFTAAGAVEAAYVVRRNECWLFGFETPGTSELVIVSRGVVVFRAEIEATELLRTSDLDGDGQSELLVALSNMHNGVIRSDAKLVTIDQGKLVVVHDFGVVTENACPSGEPRPRRTNARITYAYSASSSQRWPLFHATQKTTGCVR